MDNVAELIDAEKSFGDIRAVDRITLPVPRGTIVGMLGPSGSGKTSVIRLLLGVLTPDKGEARVFGHVPSRLSAVERAQIGYSPQLLYLYPSLTVVETMNFYASAYGLGWLRGRRKAIPQLLDEVDLTEARNRIVGDLSGGMRKRLSVARALLNDPELVFLDEPTAGIDPLLRQKMWEYIRQQAALGKSFFVTTHYAAEAEYCDRVAVVAEGRLIACGTPDELRREALEGELIDVVAPNMDPGALAALAREPGVGRIEYVGHDTIRIHVQEASTEMPRLLDTLSTRGVTVTSAFEQRPPFDEVFAALVQRNIPPVGART